MLTSYDVAPGKTQVGLIQKGTTPRLIVKIGDAADSNRLLSVIDSIGTNDDGRLLDALKFANDEMFKTRNGARPGYKRSLVVFVNEKIDAETNALKDIGIKLKDNGINVIVVGLNEEADKTKMMAVAPLNDVFFFPPLLDELDMALYPIVRSTYPGKLLEYKEHDIFLFSF